MSAVEMLKPYAGEWQGTSTLQDPHSNTPAPSPSTATLTPVLDGRFMRLDYTWAYGGQSQAGSLLIGYEADTGTATGHWIDTWHMGDKVMVCRGTSRDSGEISILGSYAAPPGPDWGWRITITPGEDEALRVVMFNVAPDGQEYLAVEANYTR